jgi:hypothetical protein
MTEPLILDLLPARGLDQSMLLPVLVGLLVVLACTETFGWVFAGAIVPGYLASVLVVQPVTGAIVVFESLVTLAISAALAKGLSKTDAWTRFFGRERFFLILAVSLVVRIHDHAWFAPWVIAQVDETFGTSFESQQEFYSVGLVLVPLTANMLWKPAVHRGIGQLAFQVGVTYLVVRYVLLPHTNLSLSSVELTYENAAINFVGHAKAHIILLSAALLSAQFNLTYGWDFNGILVPALLALLWLTPLKLVATLGEAVLVFYLVKGFLKLPVIRHLDFEGPRKIVLVFSLAFLWKLALGFSLGPLFPDLKISDTYGFGYLLSSLLAVKMIGVKSVRGVLLPSLMASAGGFVIGSVFGFVLDVLAPKPLSDERVSEPASLRLASTPLGVMTLARMDVSVHGEEVEQPSQAELGRLQDFWSAAGRLHQSEGLVGRMIAGLGGSGRLTWLDELVRLGAPLDLKIVELGRYPAGPGGELRREWLGIVADEDSPRRGFVTGLLIPEARGPVLVVPMPVSEAPVAEAAAIACRRVDCRAVLVAGRELGRAGTGVNPRPLEIAMRAFDADAVVVMRAFAEGQRGSFAGELADQLDGSASPELTSARIHQLRGNFNPVELWPRYERDWEPVETVVRPPAGDGDFVLLRTTRTEYETFVNQGAAEFGGKFADQPADEVADGGDEPGRPLTVDDLLPVLTEIYERREAPGTYGAGYRAPSDAELHALEQLVVEPLMYWADNSRAGEPPPRSVAVRAAELDYELLELGDCREGRGRGEDNGRCLVVLHEASERPTTAGWGTLVVRRQRRRGLHVIEVPRPFRERQTWRIGAELWQVVQGRALLLAGADGLPHDPMVARDVEADQQGPEGRGLAPSPDPARPGNLETAFHAIHQSLDRSAPIERGGAHSFEVVQVRGLASYRPVVRDVIIGVGMPVDDTLVEHACWNQLTAELRPLVASWDSCQVANGSEDLAYLSGAGNPQLEYSRELGNATVRMLWLSAGLRDRFAAPRSATAERSSTVRGLRQAGYEVEEIREIEAMLRPIWVDVGTSAGAPLVEVGLAGFEAALEAALGYARTGNLHELRTLARLHEGAVDLQVRAGVGQEFGQPVLIIEYLGERLGKRALVTLAHGLGSTIVRSADEKPGAASLRADLIARPQVLILTDKEIVGASRGADGEAGEEGEP